MDAGRSSWVSGFGWFWIGAGAVKIVGMTAYLAALAGTDGFGSLPEMSGSAGAPWVAAGTRILSSHLAALAVGWIALGAFIVAAGSFFLRRRPWARLGLEITCWFGIVEAPAVAMFLYGVRAMVLRAQRPAADRLVPIVVGGIGICGAWMLVYVASLPLLRGAAIRGWFAARQPSGPVRSECHADAPRR